MTKSIEYIKPYPIERTHEIEQKVTEQCFCHWFCYASGAYSWHHCAISPVSTLTFYIIFCTPAAFAILHMDRIFWLSHQFQDFLVRINSILDFHQLVICQGSKNNALIKQKVIKQCFWPLVLLCLCFWHPLFYCLQTLQVWHCVLEGY